MTTINSQTADTAKPVTLSDTAANWFSGFYVGGSGDVKIRDARGNDVTFVGAPAGSFFPVKTQLIYSTGTTATSLVGLNQA